MANNTILNPGTGGDVVRDIDKGGAKTQVVTLDLGGAGAETLISGTMPVSAISWPLATNAATETGNLASLAAKDYATQATLSALNGKVVACNTNSVSVNNFPATQTDGNVNRLPVVNDEVAYLMGKVLKELKIIRLHMEIMSDSKISDWEV